MSLLSFLFGGEKKKTAMVAKERLQLIIAHQHAKGSHQPDYLPDLQKDLIAVISKYIPINPNDIKVNIDKQGNIEVLEVNIVLPEEDDAKTDQEKT